MKNPKAPRGIDKMACLSLRTHLRPGEAGDLQLCSAGAECGKKQARRWPN